MLSVNKAKQRIINNNNTKLYLGVTSMINGTVLQVRMSQVQLNNKIKIIQKTKFAKYEQDYNDFLVLGVVYEYW